MTKPTLIKEVPHAHPAVQKCIDALQELNDEGKIRGLCAAVTMHDHTSEQHISGAYNVMAMLGTVRLLEQLIVDERNND